jgi:hypothetical protein
MQQFFINNIQTISIILLVWSTVWKGFALWKAAHREEKIWFMALLVINTFGLLEIIYLFVITKIKWNLVKEKLRLDKIFKKNE